MLPQTAPPDVIRYTSIVFASISLIGAIYICISSILHSRLRSGFSFRMILWMAIFDSILALSTLVGPLGTIEEEANEDGYRGNEEGETVLAFNLNLSHRLHSDNLPLECQLQAIGLNFAIISNLLWTLCFAIHLFRISSIRVNPLQTHSRKSMCCYLLISVVAPIISTIYIFQADMVGVSTDYWCWLKVDIVGEAINVFGIIIGIIVIVLFVLFFALKIHLKKASLSTNPNLPHLMDRHHDHCNYNNNNRNHHRNDNKEMHSVQRLMVNRSRVTLLRTISSSLSAYLVAPFVAFVPAHFNFIYGELIEFNEHVLSWYILSAILLGICHFGVYAFGISIVRHSYKVNCCNPSADPSLDNIDLKSNQSQRRMDGHAPSKHAFAFKSLQRSRSHYMELV